MRLSVIIPVLDEEARIAALVARVRAALEEEDEVLVADGGSSDGSAAAARAAGAQVLVGGRGRGNQMNAAAAHARGDVLLFLHADTILPHDFRASIAAALSDQAAVWGRYDIQFDEAGPLLALIAWMISRRSRLFRSATGDQAIFVRRGVFEAVGAYREPLLFEDVDLVRRLRGAGQMVVPRGYAVTSSRRWRNRGTLRTTALMWTLKPLYLAGVPAARLARLYSNER